MGIELFIAFALSLDGFGVGIAYGLNKIKMTSVSLVIIGLCTALARGISLLFGQLISPWLAVISPNVLGAAILMIIGSYQLIQAARKNITGKAVPVMTGAVGAEDTYITLICIKLKIFGLVIKVLKTPNAADLDGSGTINAKESVILGVALSLDAFAAGMAAAMTGISFYVIALVAILQILMLRTGQLLTGKLPSVILSKVKFLPGLLLIMIGGLKLI
jgi:putative sporulation protein YtaF